MWVELKCSIDHDTLGKNPEGRKVKGVIHWVSAEHAVEIKVRLYDRLFTVERPDAVRGEDGNYLPFTDFLNPESIKGNHCLRRTCRKRSAGRKPLAV